jgi:SAM-dependent methyltransferase
VRAIAFDAHAATYDRQFTNTASGTRMRRAVWKRCEARFPEGASILEMNCGTGEDARWLAERGVRVLATDISPAMLAVARAKVTSPLVRFQELAWEDLAALDEGPFDGVLSNFGGLNCVEDLRPIAHALAAKLRPGAIAILCIMGPVVLWEWVRFLARGNPSAAFRRLKPGGTQWSGATIRYPSIGQTRRAFSPEFRMLRVSAVGTVLPLPWLADHYLLELKRL